MAILAEMKKRRGTSYRKIAKQCGISVSNVYAHCTGQRTISAEMAVRYHTVFGIPLCELRPDLWPPDSGRDNG